MGIKAVPAILRRGAAGNDNSNAPFDSICPIEIQTRHTVRDRSVVIQKDSGVARAFRLVIIMGDAVRNYHVRIAYDAAGSIRIRQATTDARLIGDRDAKIAIAGCLDAFDDHHLCA